MNQLPRILNLGCGRKKLPDAWNVDCVASLEPDLVWNLDQTPYPLPGDSFDKILALDVVEHLSDLVAFMTEAHRLLVPGGVLEITTPHYSSSNSFTDPTHRHHLGYFSFDYFTEESLLRFYSEVRFEIIERHLAFPASRFMGTFQRWANRHPGFYERRLAWVLPAWFLIVKLRAVKTSGPAR